MKNLLLTAAAAVIITLSISSCSKCEVCTKSGSPDVRFCEKDYNSNTEYGFAIDVYTNQGYDCRKSL